MKKITAFAAAVCLTFSLTACAGNSVSSSEEATAENPLVFAKVWRGVERAKDCWQYHCGKTDRRYWNHRTTERNYWKKLSKKCYLRQGRPVQKDFSSHQNWSQSWAWRSWPSAWKADWPACKRWKNGSNHFPQPGRQNSEKYFQKRVHRLHLSAANTCMHLWAQGKNKTSQQKANHGKLTRAGKKFKVKQRKTANCWKTLIFGNNWICRSRQ